MPDEPQNPQISMHKIPVKGGIGAVLVIITLVSAMLVELPTLRFPVLVGVLVGIVLVVWHKSRAR